MAITAADVAEVLSGYSDKTWPSSVMVADWLVEAIERGWDIRPWRARPSITERWFGEGD